MGGYLRVPRGVTIRGAVTTMRAAAGLAGAQWTHAAPIFTHSSPACRCGPLIVAMALTWAQG